MTMKIHISLLAIATALLCPPSYAQDNDAADLPPAAIEAEEPAPEAPAPAPAPVAAAPEPVLAPSANAGIPATLIDDRVLTHIRSKIETELVFFMIDNQNTKYAAIDEDGILALDAQWVEERKQASKPLISATLSNPLSSYLTMVQAHSEGLFTEIFVMDNKGLNVGQSNISSDYWQGDEDKWQKTYLAGPGAVFIDTPEYDDDRKIWVVQVNLALSSPETAAATGAVTVDVNLTELQRRNRTGAAL